MEIAGEKVYFGTDADNQQAGESQPPWRRQMRRTAFLPEHSKSFAVSPEVPGECGVCHFRRVLVLLTIAVVAANDGVGRYVIIERDWFQNVELFGARQSDSPATFSR